MKEYYHSDKLENILRSVKFQKLVRNADYLEEVNEIPAWISESWGIRGILPFNVDHAFFAKVRNNEGIGYNRLHPQSLKKDSIVFVNEPYGFDDAEWSKVLEYCEANDLEAYADPFSRHFFGQTIRIVIYSKADKVAGVI